MLKSFKTEINPSEEQKAKIHKTIGTLFVPIIGERVDAHRFIPDVLETGASCVFFSDDREKERKGAGIYVSDTLLAMQKFAAWYRSKLPVRIIGITGSVGKTTTKEMIAAVLETKYRTVKTYKNLNSQIGVALMMFELDEDTELAVKLCNSFGKTEIIPENLMDVVTGVSGSSPAYVFMFIEAMADAAVADGMPRAMAYELAAQTVYGSAKMVLETGKHPGELKDMVCSPAGTTIEAVRVLEEKGLRSAVIEGQMACVKKAREL